MKKIIRKVVVIWLVIVFMLPNMNFTIATAYDINNQCTKASTSTATYMEKELKFEHKGDCESGPWDIKKDNDGTIYAYEWDTYDEITDTTDSFWVGLHKMKWSKDGTLSYQKIRLSSKFTHRIESGGYIGVTEQDSNENLFVTYEGKYKKKEREMLTVIDKNGAIIRDYVLNDKVKHFKEKSDISIYDIYISDSEMLLYVREDRSIHSIQTFNWKTGKRLSAIEIEKLEDPTIKDGFIYGIKKTSSMNENSDDSIKDTSSYNLVKLTLDGSMELWSQPLPKGKAETIRDDDEYYNKFDYDIAGTYAYVCNTEGIFSADTSVQNEGFSLIMSPNNSKYLSNYYSIVDLKVINEKCLYLLSIDGEDEEWPTDLGMYTLN